MKKENKLNEQHDGILMGVFFAIVFFFIGDTNLPVSHKVPQGLTPGN